MLPLPTEHDDKTFTYTQVEREGDIAIFCQAHKACRSQRFEVVKIRVQPAHTWPNMCTTGFPSRRSQHASVLAAYGLQSAGVESSGGRVGCLVITEVY